MSASSAASRRFGELREALHGPSSGRMRRAGEVLAQMEGAELEAALPYARQLLGGGNYSLWLSLAQSVLSTEALFLEALQCGELAWVCEQLRLQGSCFALANTDAGWGALRERFGEPLDEVVDEVARQMLQELLRWGQRLQTSLSEAYGDNTAYIELVQRLVEQTEERRSVGAALMEVTEQFWSEESDAEHPGYLFWGFGLHAAQLYCDGAQMAPREVMLQQMSRQLTLACFEVLAATSQDMSLCNPTLIEAEARIGSEAYDALAHEIEGMILIKLAAQLEAALRAQSEK